MARNPDSWAARAFRRGMPLVMLAVVLAGCTSPPAALGEVCKRQHTEQPTQGPVVVCDELHAQAPHLRLPGASSGRVFAHIMGPDFVALDGRTFPAPHEGVEWEEARLQGEIVYELTLASGEVRSFKPVVRVPDALFLAPLLGQAAEGTVSARDGERYRLEPSLPVRVTFQAQPASDNRSRYAEAVGTIANLAEATKASDGRCLPALTSHGAASPFATTERVSLRAYRHPSMHVPGAHKFVILYQRDGEDQGSMMGDAWYQGPIDLARGPLALNATYEGTGHAAPGGIPVMKLRMVNGGGEACTPA